MLLTDYQFVRMTPSDKRLLLELARVEERNPSDLVRFLIRHAAREKGLRDAGTPHTRHAPPMDAVGAMSA